MAYNEGLSLAPQCVSHYRNMPFKQTFMVSNVRKACNFSNLKVPYYEKDIFFGLYKYKLFLPEPANSQNEENKRVLHGLCSPPTGKMAGCSDSDPDVT